MRVTGLAFQLRTTDLERAIDFYVGRLGGNLSFCYEDFYAGVDVGDHRIHLKLVDTPDPGIAYVAEGDHLHLWILVEDLDGAFRRLQGAGVHIVEGICERPWGMNEFVVRDPDGHTLYFAEPIAT